MWLEKSFQSNFIIDVCKNLWNVFTDIIACITQTQELDLDIYILPLLNSVNSAC